MAEGTDKEQPRMAQPRMAQPRMAQPDDAERMRRAAQDAAEVAASPPTETVAGGRYRVGDTLVDANGEPLTEGAGRRPVGSADSAPSVKAGE